MPPLPAASWRVARVIVVAELGTDRGAFAAADEGNPETATPPGSCGADPMSSECAVATTCGGRIGRVDRRDLGQRAMNEEPQQSLGEMRATISREMVRLQAEYYGKGPTRAKTYIVDDVVVVVLEESFTRAEKTLAERGEREAIQHIRRRFQQQMAESFTGVVEQATGRKVRVFLSETDIEQDVSVETFLLAEERTDMTGFEET